MKKITEITNREEIVEMLADMLQQFDRDLNSYQTDVYMYIDEETGAATLDTFVNVGGNSWLDDDHTTVYTDKEHFDSMYDYYCNNGDFADAIDMEHTELQRETAKHLADSGKIDADEAEDYEPDWHEIKEYIETCEDYVEKLTECYYESIERCAATISTAQRKSSDTPRSVQPTRKNTESTSHKTKSSRERTAPGTN